MYFLMECCLADMQISPGHALNSGWAYAPWSDLPYHMDEQIYLKSKDIETTLIYPYLVINSLFVKDDIHFTDI